MTALSIQNKSGQEVARTSPLERKPPTHIIRELQGPLEESFKESTLEAQVDSPPTSLHLLDARSRRNRLLGADAYERICAGKWRQRKGEQYHPLWKLIAQLSFGVHLLAKSAAKSETESVEKLQGLVNEFDGFVQRTSEDLETAAQDIRKRIDLLEVPLRHLGVFDTMLKNPNFRLSIFRINGNIGHVAQRSFVAMQDALKDVDKGLQCVDIFARYVKELEESSIPRSSTFEAIQATMAANVCGWNSTLLNIRAKGIELTQLLNWLSLASLEIQRRAAFASSKHSASSDDGRRPSTAKSTQVQTKTDPDSVRRHLRLLWKRINVSTGAVPVSRTKASLDKPLPRYPQPLAGVDDDLIGQILLSYDSSNSQPGQANLALDRSSLEEGDTDDITPHPRSASVASSRALGGNQTPIPGGQGTGQDYDKKNGNAEQSRGPGSRGYPAGLSLSWDTDVKPQCEMRKNSSLTVETRSESSPTQQALSVPRSTTGMSLQSPTWSTKLKGYPKRKWSAVGSISSALRKRSDS